MSHLDTLRTERARAARDHANAAARLADALEIDPAAYIGELAGAVGSAWAAFCRADQALYTETRAAGHVRNGDKEGA